MDIAALGGIKEHQDLERFTAFASEVAVKDQRDLMSRCWFSLSAKRTEPIEHEYTDARSGRQERIRITGSPEHGIATIHDQDLLIFVISQWIEASRVGVAATRRIHFTPYQFFAWINRKPTGSAYQRLKEALHRLKTTNIETTRQFGNRSVRRQTRQFSWVSEWEMLEENGAIRGVEVVLAEWLFESIQDFHVLTLDKRYFEISGSVERWLYLYARKATGNPDGMWKEGFRSLYKKSASQQAYKHYASALRRIIERNDLPGLKLERCASASGLDMLRMERIDKREAIEARAGGQQQQQQELAFMERTPLEEAWENVLDMLRKSLSAPTVSSWMEKLDLLGLEEELLSFRAPSKFIAEHVQSRFGLRIREAWRSLGYEVKEIVFQVKSLKQAA
jgi:plasmid replication initiation protein